MFLKVSHTAYLLLMGNMMLALATFPVWTLLVFAPLQRTWLALFIVSPLLAPAVAAGFALFADFVNEGDPGVVRPFWRHWAGSARRTLPIGAGAAVLGLVIGVDVRAVVGTAWAPLTLPGLVVCAGLGLATFIMALALIVTHPNQSGWRAAKLGLTLCVHAGGWSLLSLAALTALAAMVWARPALAVVAGFAPVLFVVWFNTRRALETTTSNVEAT